MFVNFVERVFEIFVTLETYWYLLGKIAMCNQLS